MQTQSPAHIEQVGMGWRVARKWSWVAGQAFGCPVEPQLREASVSKERTFVGLDVHAVRREALIFRMGVRDPRRLAVVAAG